MLINQEEDPLSSKPQLLLKEFKKRKQPEWTKQSITVPILKWLTSDFVRLSYLNLIFIDN